MLFRSNLNISAGEKIALVGESGSGKTSLIKLLMRFYDIDEGVIYYNGINIKDIPLKLLREKISVVSQDTYLFNGTIEENLRLAKPDASLSEIDEAVKAANIYDFILDFLKHSSLNNIKLSIKTKSAIKISV